MLRGANLNPVRFLGNDLVIWNNQIRGLGDDLIPIPKVLAILNLLHGWFNHCQDEACRYVITERWVKDCEFKRVISSPFEVDCTGILEYQKLCISFPLSANHYFIHEHSFQELYNKFGNVLVNDFKEIRLF